VKKPIALWLSIIGFGEVRLRSEITKRIWNRATHLRHAAAQDCPFVKYSRFWREERIIAKGLCLLRFVTSGFGHLLAQQPAVGSVGMSLSATGPKNQGNSGSATVSGQNSQWDCLLPIEPTNCPIPLKSAN